MIILLTSYSVRAWFTLDDISLHRIHIIRVNEFETMSLTGTNFDYGDTSPLIVSNYGAGVISATNAFVCGWPVTFSLYFTRRTNDGGGPYTSAILEYHSGTNATSDTNWVQFAEITEDQFNGVEGVVGSHFGITTWYPPNVSNALYLVRMWARIETGPGNPSADRTVTNITAKGDGFSPKDDDITNLSNLFQIT